MKLAALAFTLAGLLVCNIAAQHPPPPNSGPGGFRGFGDPNRRLEMLADCLAEDIGLDQNQRKEMLEILTQTMTAAKPLQEELQEVRQSIKVAIKAGKKSTDLESLHEQIGTINAKLAGIQSSAFAQACKSLKETQKDNADVIFETLGLVAGQGGRPGSMIHAPPRAVPGDDTHNGKGRGNVKPPR